MSRVTHIERVVLATILAALMASAAPAAVPESAESIYTRALSRERELREGPSGATPRPAPVGGGALRDRRRAVTRRAATATTRCGRAANVALLAFERFEQAADRRTAVRLLTLLREGYPSSPSARTCGRANWRASTRLGRLPRLPRRLFHRPPSLPRLRRSQRRRPWRSSRPRDDRLETGRRTAGRAAAVAAAAAVATIRDIKRTPLPDGVRVSIELDAESRYRYERLDNPRRVFFDLKGDACPGLAPGCRPQVRRRHRARDSARTAPEQHHADRGGHGAVETYSVFTLYNPFRLVVDFKRDAVGDETGRPDRQRPDAGSARPRPRRRHADRPGRPEAGDGDQGEGDGACRQGAGAARCRGRQRPLPQRCPPPSRRRPTRTASSRWRGSSAWASRASSSTPATAATIPAPARTASRKRSWCSTSRCGCASCSRSSRASK